MNKLFFSLAACLASLSFAACTADTTPSPTETQPDGETAEDLSASKCKGILPHLCEVCSDGTSACAHWAVKHKKCAIETCATPSTCVQRVMCTTQSHFDHTACKCVPNTCVQNVLCTSTGHFDPTTCQCVAN